MKPTKLKCRPVHKGPALTLRTQNSKIGPGMPERSNFRVVIINGSGQNEEVWRFQSTANGVRADELPLGTMKLSDHDTIKDSVIVLGWRTTPDSTKLNFAQLPKKPDHIYVFVMPSPQGQTPSLGWECTQNTLADHTKLDMNARYDDNMIETITFHSKSVVELVGAELEIGNRTEDP